MLLKILPLFAIYVFFIVLRFKKEFKSIKRISYFDIKFDIKIIIYNGWIEWIMWFNSTLLIPIIIEDNSYYFLHFILFTILVFKLEKVSINNKN